MKLKISILSLLSLFLFSGVSAFGDPPSQVLNVEAKLIGENSVNLSWDEATSEDGVVVAYKVYYGNKSVKSANERYENEEETEVAQTAYALENLEAGKTYYLAVTALDDQMNESVNYSEEVFIEIPLLEKTQDKEQGQGELVEDPFVEDSLSDEAKPIEEPLVVDPIEEPIQPVIEEQNKPAASVDFIPPVDAKNLRADRRNLEKTGEVLLTWQKSANLEGDVVDQMLYTKKGSSSWDQGKSIGKDLEQMPFKVDKNQDYALKIVTLDANGNRSSGANVVFSTNELTTSGGKGITSLIIAGVLMFMIIAMRRKA